MKIIFEGTGESSDRFIYAECLPNAAVVRIEDLSEPDKGKELTLTPTELALFIERLQDILSQIN